MPDVVSFNHYSHFLLCIFFIVYYLCLLHFETDPTPTSARGAIKHPPGLNKLYTTKFITPTYVYNENLHSNVVEKNIFTLGTELMRCSRKWKVNVYKISSGSSSLMKEKMSSLEK